jgi:hypothetical protein
MGVLLLTAMTGWSCGYDFDAPFSDSPGAGGAGGTATGGSGGTATGGTGGTATGGTGGTATGGTGGTATGGTGSTTTGGTGGTLGPEDCTNGKDDNGDGLVDCADPQCAPDYQCEIAPPSGWSNVGYKAERSVNAPATDCSGFDALEFKRDLVAPDTGCDCSCSEPQGGECSVTTSRLWQNPDCGGLYADVSLNTCDDYPSTWAVGSVRTGTFTYTPGTCSPGSSGTPTEATWMGAVDVCLTKEQGGGCGAGAVCVKKPTTALEPAACVHQAGSVACPAAYPEQNVYHDGFDDGRACSASACSCGAPNGSCAAVVLLYNNTSCTGAPAGAYPLGGACHNTGFPPGTIRGGFVAVSLTPGTCTPFGSAGSGAVTPTDPHTVCCSAL